MKFRKRIPRPIKSIKVGIIHPMPYIKAVGLELRYKNPIYIGTCSICGKDIVENFKEMTKSEFSLKYSGKKLDKLIEKLEKKYLKNERFVCKACQGR